ncbi:hypothetical protein D3C77_430260 [compost metagenome]
MPDKDELGIASHRSLLKAGVFGRLARRQVGLAHVRVDDIVLAVQAAVLISSASNLPSLTRSIQKDMK